MIPSRTSQLNRGAGRRSLLPHEIASMPALSLNSPLPEKPRLAAVCRAFLQQPSLEVGIDDMVLGYSSSSAFATVFKQVLGEVPSRYF
jgi:hypothetical protein